LGRARITGRWVVFEAWGKDGDTDAKHLRHPYAFSASPRDVNGLGGHDSSGQGHSVPRLGV